MLAFNDIRANSLLYSLTRCLCFSLILLPVYPITTTTKQTGVYFVVFTFVYENFVFLNSQFGNANIVRYAITLGLILNCLSTDLTRILRRPLGHQREPKPIILRYWQSISKLLPFIWPSNNVRLQLYLGCCAVLLLLGRITAVFAPVYGKRVGMFFHISDFVT